MIRPEGASNNRKHLKIWESALFGGKYMWLKFHQNRRYLIFQGHKPPTRGGYMWPEMPIFELGRAIPVRSHVWTFGSDWLSLSRVIMSTNIFPGGGGGINHLLGGYIWPVMSIFELGWAIPVKSHVLKFGLDWLKSEEC